MGMNERAPADLLLQFLKLKWKRLPEDLTEYLNALKCISIPLVMHILSMHTDRKQPYRFKNVMTCICIL